MPNITERYGCLEAVSDLAIGIVFRKNEYVTPLLINAHEAMSSRTRAPTRSPLIWISSSFRTIVGSKWSLLRRTRVFSSEKTSNRFIVMGGHDQLTTMGQESLPERHHEMTHLG